MLDLRLPVAHTVALLGAPPSRKRFQTSVAALRQHDVRRYREVAADAAGTAGGCGPCGGARNKAPRCFQRTLLSTGVGGGANDRFVELAASAATPEFADRTMPLVHNAVVLIRRDSKRHQETMENIYKVNASGSGSAMGLSEGALLP